MSDVNLEKMIPIEKITGEDADETAQLKEMLGNSINYLQGFKWCPPIDRVFLGCGIGGVVAVFLFHFQERINETDDCLWVVEGDLPTMHLVLDQASDPASALEVYCQLMDEWTTAVLDGKSLKEVFPIDAEPSLDNAKNLLKRLHFIRTRILPDWRTIWPANRVGES
jgi:hypothetical protein